MQKLLQTCGYEPDEIYVSCDYEANKGTGAIQKIINGKYPNKKIIHIGDNYLSDIKGSQKAGWDTYYYKKCSEIAKSYKEPVYTSNTGGGQAHSIVQPSKVVNRWHREA